MIKANHSIQTSQLIMLWMVNVLLVCGAMGGEAEGAKILKRGGAGQVKIPHIVGGRLMADLIDAFQNEMEDETQNPYAGKYRGIRQLGEELSEFFHCDGVPGDPRLDQLSAPQNVSHEFRISTGLLLEHRRVGGHSQYPATAWRAIQPETLNNVLAANLQEQTSEKLVGRQSNTSLRFANEEYFKATRLWRLPSTSTAPTGRLYMFVVVADLKDDFGKTVKGARFIYSDDEGGSWRVSDQMFVRNMIYLNTQYGERRRTRFVIEQKDGTLNYGIYLVVRIDGGAIQEYITWDEGTTWTSRRALLSSNTLGVVRQLNDGRMLMFLHACYDWHDPDFKYAKGGREKLHALISHDYGKSWRGCREVSESYLNINQHGRGDHGTQIMTTRRGVNADSKELNDTVYVIGGQRPAGIFISKVNASWLEEEECVEDFSGFLDERPLGTLELDGWTVYGAQGIGRMAHPSLPTQSVLQIKKESPHDPSTAIWNFASLRAGQLSLNIRLDENFKGHRMMLTDHFIHTMHIDVQAKGGKLGKPSVDTDAEKGVLFLLDIDQGGKIEGGDVVLPRKQWIDLTFRWSMDEKRCEILLGDKKVHTLELRDRRFSVEAAQELSPDVLKSMWGPCYVRFTSLSPDGGDGGILINRLETKPRR